MSSTVSEGSIITPRFSVVVPLFNKETYIGETLASIRAQTFRDFEIVVVDDGSTDDSVRVVEGTAISELRLVTQPNGGPGLARNRGIEESRGEWVAFLDADDLWLPDHLATLDGIIRDFPDVDLVSSAFVRGRRGDLRAIAVERPTVAPPRLIDFFAEHEKVWTSVVAIRRAVARSSGGFRAHWPGEDLELWTRLAPAHRFAATSLVTAVYVQGTGGAMDTQSGTPTTVQNVDELGVFKTIAAILESGRYEPLHDSVRAYRRRLLLSFVRPALFHGETEMAREYLSRLRAEGGTAPVTYTLLAKVPPRLLRRGMQAYSRSKQHVLRLLQRQSP